MSNIDPEAVAWTARLDQYRANASRVLDGVQQLWRTLAEEFNDERAFTCIVAEIIRLVDPNDELCNEHSNRLTLVAEMLATAISRIDAKP
ncbi:hypothetical protein KL864_27135 [Mycolicibacterium goodii]|uniref:hypothetical protein n=1 Tax=Mycolicibacterium goodii TaxID=134601 RepID=UPI001BDDA345|nr:hypothetical protein [Mycolicibacterium goodii]MBU8819565.1 hypothetical protein [Mycolicibacterium goodii]